MEKDKPLINDMLKLSLKHPRYGYRRITILLREDDWLVNFKRVYRLWCQESLKVHRKQHKKAVAIAVTRKDPNITTMYGVMIF